MASNSSSSGSPLGDQPNQPSSFTFPKRKIGEKHPVYRSFQPSWFRKYPWLHYDQVNDKAAGRESKGTRSRVAECGTRTLSSHEGGKAKWEEREQRLLQQLEATKLEYAKGSGAVRSLVGATDSTPDSPSLIGVQLEVTKRQLRSVTVELDSNRESGRIGERERS